MILHDGLKSLAERLGRDCSSPNPDDLVNAIDAMFSELRADLVHAPSRSKPSDVEVTEAMKDAGMEVWANTHPLYNMRAVMGTVYVAMRALEPERPVEITEAMIERAITAGQGGDSWRSWASAKPYRDGMRRALEAALSTPPSEGETR